MNKTYVGFLLITRQRVAGFRLVKSRARQINRSLMDKEYINISQGKDYDRRVVCSVDFIDGLPERYV